MTICVVQTGHVTCPDDICRDEITTNDEKDRQTSVNANSYRTKPACKDVGRCKTWQVKKKRTKMTGIYWFVMLYVTKDRYMTCMSDKCKDNTNLCYENVRYMCGSHDI